MTKGMSQRQQRVARVIQEVVAAQLMRLGPDVLAGQPCSVSRVWVSPDLKQATVFMSLFGLNNELTPSAMVEQLTAHSGVFAKALGRQLTTKFTPKLKFAFDEAFAHESRLQSLLTTLKGD